MSKETERIEAMADILHEIGIEASIEQIKQIAEDFASHLEMEREIDSYQYSSTKQECDKCKTLKSELSEANRQIGVYVNSVKQRRNATNVWLEGDTVKYDKD